MRHVSRMRRINLGLSYDVIHHDGSINVECGNAKQQCVGIFAEGFTSSETRRHLLSSSALFGMKKVTMQRSEQHACCSVTAGRSHCYGDAAYI